MSEEKFISDTKTVLKFIQLYCDEKHKDIEKTDEILNLNYKNKELNEKVEFNLCPACKETFLYSYKKLQECPHEEKPRCRKCPNPCYERSEWKKLAKIMKYGGIKLGLVKIKKIFTR
jgi:hypothetical protein